LQWLIHMRLEYTKRRDVLLAACEKYLPAEIVSWDPPAAGMFVCLIPFPAPPLAPIYHVSLKFINRPTDPSTTQHWLEIAWRKHPSAEAKDILAIEEELFLAAIEKGVLLSRGSWFRAETGGVPERMFFRATFAAALPEKMVEAIELFGRAIREAFRLM
jgi:aromatic amino acid aminotransferase I